MSADSETKSTAMSSGSEHPKWMVIIVMGVSGTGQIHTWILARQKPRMPYVEGDDLHPKSNVAKMSAGHPLNDKDREPWLELIRTTAESKIVEMQAQLENSSAETKGGLPGVVITCSSLKKYYREILRGRRKPASKEDPSEEQRIPAHLEPTAPSLLPTYFVFINGPRDLIWERMSKRPGHFMKASMLDSQLETLEDPRGEDGVVEVSLEDSTERQIKAAKDGIAKSAGEWFLEEANKVDSEAYKSI